MKTIHRYKNVEGTPAVTQPATTPATTPAQPKMPTAPTVYSTSSIAPAPPYYMVTFSEYKFKRLSNRTGILCPTGA